MKNSFLISFLFFLIFNFNFIFSQNQIFYQQFFITRTPDILIESTTKTTDSFLAILSLNKTNEENKPKIVKTKENSNQNSNQNQNQNLEKNLNQNLEENLNQIQNQIYHQDSQSLLTSIITGSFPSKHGITSKWWLQKFSPFKSTIMELFAQIFPEDSMIISFSSDEKISTLTGLRKEIQKSLKYKNLFTSSYQQKNKKLVGFPKVKAKSFKEFFDFSNEQPEIFINFIKNGGKIIYNEKMNLLSIFSLKSNIDVDFNLNDSVICSFIAEIMGLDYIIKFAKEKNKTISELRLFTTITFASLSEIRKNSTENFNDAIKILDVILPEFIKQFQLITNKSFITELLFINEQKLEKKHLAKLIFDTFKKEIITDEETTFKIFPEIYLKKNLTSSQIEKICSEIQNQILFDFNSNSSINYKIHCFGKNENRLTKEVHPLSKKFYINEAKQFPSNLPFSKDLKRFFGTIILILLTFLFFFLFCSMKQNESKKLIL
ncbi:hypothetical protein M0811_01437 [Anaeramoeba ignava]|uniref:Transmembrane protein n=1 Tax=Anaeramoeba ignava TaxID=1746090 RepID=A0A9Q0LGF7_ANAIG|nr:hypothetical protein M0811_01437 [Anaeramoeba ignava]